MVHRLTFDFGATGAEVPQQGDLQFDEKVVEGRCVLHQAEANIQLCTIVGKF
jgi:hypothetical protein